MADLMVVSFFFDNVASRDAGASKAELSIEPRLMARALAGLFAAGALLSLVTLLLPHSDSASVPGLLIVIGNAILMAAYLYAGGERVPRWILPISLAWGTLQISGVAYFSGEAPSPLVFFYLWIYLYSAYFFTRLETALQLGFVALNFGALLLVATPSDGAASWWLVGMGSMMVAAALILVMRERAGALISQLYEAARIDPLTKLMNRRGFRERLDLELERAKRSEVPMTVVIGDADYFKEVNDRAGHAVGDIVLQRLARILESGTRGIDTAARVGGEEFALVLTDTDEGGAYTLCERLREAVVREFSEETVPVTISFGIASYPSRAETAGALLRTADEALYAAKANGRNRSVIYSNELGESTAERPGKRDIGGERYLAILLDLAEAADLRFSGSARHSETVGRYAEMMATELGLTERHADRVRIAGVLHDIGKVSIPEAILQKPGKLDAEEWETIKRHPELGAQLVEHRELTDIRDWIASHHERPDGTGYPRGIIGAELPLEARILAVADAYEAMTCDRAYKAALGHAKARTELKRCSGTQFDPVVVKALITVLDREAERADVARAALPA